jgi:hypothetical protein
MESIPQISVVEKTSGLTTSTRMFPMLSNTTMA